MNTKVWDNLPDMLEDIWRHRRETGDTILSFDDPKAMRFGFVNESQTHGWQIQRGVVARYFNTNLPRDERRQNIGLHFKTAETRATLANLGSFP